MSAFDADQGRADSGTVDPIAGSGGVDSVVGLAAGFF